MKCDRVHPCSNCAKYKRECAFLAPATDLESRERLTRLKEKMGQLERSLARTLLVRLEKEMKNFFPVELMAIPLKLPMTRKT